MSIKKGILFAALLLCAALAQAQVYTWKDANGQTHFSDTPPPNVVTKKSSSSTPATAVPTTTTTDASAPVAKKEKTWQEKDAEFKQRRAEAEEKAAKQKEEDAAKQKKAEQCTALKNHLAIMEKNGRVGTPNDKGGVDIFTDEQRKAEIKNARDRLSKNCS